MKTLGEKRGKMKIEIDNLTKAQELAVIDMLYAWRYNGGVGHSSYVAFYADGDGNFQPNILVNGEKPERYKMANGEWAGKEKEGIYKIDFDMIARDLHFNSDAKRGSSE
jgi:hypothetical protein